MLGGPVGEVGVIVGTVWRRGSVPGAAHVVRLEETRTTMIPVSTKMNPSLLTVHAPMGPLAAPLAEDNLELPVHKEIRLEHDRPIQDRTGLWLRGHNL